MTATVLAAALPALERLSQTTAAPAMMTASAGQGDAPAGLDSARDQAVTAMTRQTPIRFEPNVGQAPEAVKFLSRGQGYSLGLTARGAFLSLRRTGPAGGDEPLPVQSTTLRMHLVSADPAAAISAEQSQASVSHYFLGNDPAQWHRDVPNYGAVRYSQVYPGVDWVLYGNPQHLEYDLVVAPEADPSKIKLAIDGAQKLALDDDGNLAITVKDATLLQHRPVSYQIVNGEKRPVASRYVLDVKNQQIAFALGDHDRHLPVTIDPVLVYSTYLGGTGSDYGRAVAVDNNGNAYIAGQTGSSDFPTLNPYNGTHSGGTNSTDVFVSKFSPAGQLLYSTYVGGNNEDNATGIAVDPSNYIYVVGSTASTNFPTSRPSQAANGGGTDAFVFELNSNGNSLYYSTYLGGSGNDQAYAVAVNSNDAYVTGSTTSTNFPLLGAQQTGLKGTQDIFVTKLDDIGGRVYSTYYGGSGVDTGLGIAVDSSGDAYVTGKTNSIDFLTTSPLRASNAGGDDAFLFKLSPSGAGRYFSTYLGGSDADAGNAIALDSSGNAYIAGQTKSTNFPLVKPLQQVTAGATDAFLTKVSVNGDAILYSTYLGGYSDDIAFAVAVDSTGSAYVGGYTASQNYPTANALQSSLTGFNNGFVSKLTPAGDALRFSTYLGGNYSDLVSGIAVDKAGYALATGSTSSSNFPTAKPTQGYGGGNSDAFLTRIGPAPSILQFGFTQYSVDESGGSAYITVERTGSLDGPATATYTASAGSATAGTDFTAVSGTLSWADGDSASKSFTVPIIDNATQNPDKTVLLSLSAPNPAASTQLGSPSTATLVINDDDAPAAQAGVAFSSAGYSVSEAGKLIVITVQRTGNTNKPASVVVSTADGSATAPADYTSVNQTLIWNAGDSSAQSFNLFVKDNFTESGDKTVYLTLSSPNNVVLSSPSTAVLTIVDDEAGKPGQIQLTNTQFNVAENAGMVAVTLTRSSGKTGQACVLVATANGTALAGTDYAATSNSLCFADNEVGPRNFTIPIINNSIVDGTRSFAVNLSNPSGGGLGAPASAAVSIADDDVAPANGVLQFAAATYSVTEGGIGKVYVSRTGGSSGAVSVHVTTQDGTAIQPGDYTKKSGTLSWSDGDSATKGLSITTIDDTAVEGNETLKVIFDTTPTGGASIGTQSTTTLTIVDNDSAPAATASKVAFGAPEYRVVQGTPVATVTVNRTGSSSGVATVQMQRPADPLTHGTEPVVDSIRFEDGDASTQSIDIPLAGYNLLTGTQTVPLALVNPAGASIGDGPGQSTLVVQDGRINPKPAGADSGAAASAGGGAISPALMLPLLLLGWRRRRSKALRLGRG